MTKSNIDLQTLIICLSKLKKVSLKSQAKMLKPYGLCNREVSYVMALSKGPMTMKELSEALCVDPANTTRVIASLTESGYVANDCKREGCRKFNVFLTEKGNSLAEQIKKDVVDCGVEVMNPLTQEEQKTFIELLFKMARGADE